VLLLQCDGCGSTTTVDCSCPPELATLPLHLDQCALKDLDAALDCKPGASCCTDDHGGVSHGAWANACPAAHDDAPCPAPKTCRSWGGMAAAVADLDPANPAHMAVKTQLETLYGRPVAGDCPGGHCAQGVDGCQVCRPLTITLIGGTVLRPAGVS
jgi:hypothetical protein